MPYPDEIMNARFRMAIAVAFPSTQRRRFAAPLNGHEAETADTAKGHPEHHRAGPRHDRATASPICAAPLGEHSVNPSHGLRAKHAKSIVGSMPSWFGRGIERLGLRRAGSGESADAAFQRGLQLEQRRDVAGAEAAYRLADERGSAEGASNLGVLLYERHDVSRAEACLRRADARGSASGAFRLGVLLEDSGNLPDAEVAYRRGVTRGNPHAVDNLRLLLRKRGDVAGARELPDVERPKRVDNAVGNVWELNLALGIEAAKTGKIDSAIDVFRTIAEHAPAAFAGSAAFCMGHLLHQKGDVEASMKPLRQAVVSAPPMHALPAALLLGALLAKQGDRAAALALLRPVAESCHPEHGQSAELCLGGIYESAGDTASARAAYGRARTYGDPVGRMNAEKALRSLPPAKDDVDIEKAAVALVDEGERLFGSERYEEALVAYWHAIEISRSLAFGDHHGYEIFLAGASNNVGMCLRKLRRLKEAECAFREAADICQRRWNADADMIGDMYADVLEAHAAVLSEIGHFKEAMPVTSALVAQCRLSAKAAPATRTAGLAKALRRFAWVRAPLSIELDESLVAVTEALAIFQRLAESSPTTGDEEMKVTNGVLAAVLEKLGR